MHSNLFLSKATTSSPHCCTNSCHQHQVGIDGKKWRFLDMQVSLEPTPVSKLVCRLVTLSDFQSLVATPLPTTSALHHSRCTH